jgi:acyl-CoA thioesterase-2
MPQSLDELVALLDLEVLEQNLFRGAAPATQLQRTFGGQVAGQALMAAGRTVGKDAVPARPEPLPLPGPRHVHSLHAYFLHAGDPATPIVYDVERVRDGRSFSTRRVIAVQHGRPIFVLSASFQVPEPGLDHADPAPDAPHPDEVPTMEERIAAAGRPATAWKEWDALDVRHVGPRAWGTSLVGPDGRPRSLVWLRADGTLPDDPLLHACVLTYASDLTLLSASLQEHEVDRTAVQMASLDHAMWFHRPLRADEWLLYDQVSPSASGGRGLSIGRVFSRDGRLVATVVQEGLIRLATPPTP